MTHLCDVAAELGGAAKSSGAGGGDCGIALVGSDVDKDAVYRGWRAAVISAPMRPPARNWVARRSTTSSYSSRNPGK
ncbi:hypothetical protein R6G99_06465 [Actinotignum timonense]|nr:hypothetical protein [Actinotignum timonense]